MTNVNRAKTAVLAALALIVILPATAAVISAEPGGTVPAPAQLDGSVEIGAVEVLPGPSAAVDGADAGVAPSASTARPRARPASARAVPRAASCRTVELDQGGRPDHRSVLACD